MRVSMSRVWCAALFYALISLLSPGCSSDEQQVQEEIGQGEENYQQGEEGEDGEQYAQGQEDQQAEDDQYAEDEEYAEDDEDVDQENEEEFANNEGNENEILNSAQTNEDLQSIIAGQNGDNGEQAPIQQAVEEAPGEELAQVAEEVPAEDVAAAPVAAAPVAVTGQSLPQMGSKMPYIVKSGETLSQIAQKIFGNSESWREIAELSAIDNPRRILPGDVVYYQLSEQTLAFASAYENVGMSEVTVQPGDSLASIARRVYGSELDWKIIARHNGMLFDNADRIEVGQTLYYLNPEQLSAQVNHNRSMQLADLIRANFDKTPANAVQQNIDNTQETVTGFDIAKNMFDTFAGNFGIAG